MELDTVLPLTLAGVGWQYDQYRPDGTPIGNHPRWSFDSPAAISESFSATPKPAELPDDPGHDVSSRYADDPRHDPVGRPVMILIVNNHEADDETLKQIHGQLSLLYLPGIFPSFVWWIHGNQDLDSDQRLEVLITPCLCLS